MWGNKDLIKDYNMPNVFVKGVINRRTIKMNEWKKVEDTIFKFEKEGDLVEGKLVDKQHGSTYDNEVYKVEQKDKSVVTVFGTTVLDSQLRLVDIGQEIKIVFSGTKPPKRKGHNPLKLFEVYSK